jgi:hypothetical protein
MSSPATPVSSSLTGRDILAKYRRMLLGHQSTLLVGAFLMAIPATWIAKVHSDFKAQPDARKRMVIGQVAFWSSMLVGFKILHASLFTLPNRKVLLPAGFFALLKKLGPATTRGPAAATLLVMITGFGSFMGGMIGGFEGGRRLAKFLVPKAPRPSQCQYYATPTPGSSLSRPTPNPLFTKPLHASNTLASANASSKPTSAFGRRSASTLPVYPSSVF